MEGGVGVGGELADRAISVFLDGVDHGGLSVEQARQAAVDAVRIETRSGQERHADDCPVCQAMRRDD